MQRLEVSGAVRPIYGSLGVKRLREVAEVPSDSFLKSLCQLYIWYTRKLLSNDYRDDCHHVSAPVYYCCKTVPENA